MNTLVKHPLSAACASVLLSATLMAGHVQAEEATEANPLQFYTGDNGSYAKVTLEADLGFFTQGNSNFGASTDSDSWWESLIRPGLDVSYTLPSSQRIYGLIDAVQANTFGGIDAGGTNASDWAQGDVHDLRIDHAYVGWRSGNLFNSLGEDFLDLSFGRQNYVAGDGFLFASQGYGGFNRAAYWIGGRKSAEYAGIARMKSGNWSGDLVYFEADDRKETDTQVGGGNLNYAVEKVANIGGGFYSISSDLESRDSMKVYNVRGGIYPFALADGAPALKTFKIDAEYVHEAADGNYDNGNAWYIAPSYQFEAMPWTPTLTYRYASFNENYDSLFYGSSDWGNWYQGEILGEYIIDNSNLKSHMIKLKVQPTESVAVNLIYYKFMIDDTATASDIYSKTVTSDSLADEYNLIVDWTVNPHLSVSVVGAIADPDDAAAEIFGDDTWSYMMLFGCIKF
ncbi:alginate export family protein [Desulfobulbus sp.]|uniref:alginate export family protein n=1 Tax=Desulfobulbus sp. TaxID=895 RepID=UPI0027B8F292|nr:alginate export family protein [Desulfobulbus sp.]